MSSPVEVGRIATVFLKDFLFLKDPFLPAAVFHLPFPTQGHPDLIPAHRACQGLCMAECLLWRPVL